MIPRPKYKHKKQKPPKTVRLCKVCNKKVVFVYNPRTCHSECELCGSRNLVIWGVING